MTGELKDRPYIDGLLDRIQEEEKAATGKTAAYFRLPNAEGKQITRSNFKDQYLLIHFWASWDTVSRDSNAVYRRIYRKEQKNLKKYTIKKAKDIIKLLEIIFNFKLLNRYSNAVKSRVFIS